MNSNFKRSFEPNFYSQFNPIKKLRLDNGNERPAFALIQSHSTKQSNQGCAAEHRPKFKAHHKCKPENIPVVKPSFQFKARPMPNFANPFVPKHFKHTTTSVQGFNLSCYVREQAKTSMSRCDTPESGFGSSFLSQKTESPGQFVFKARPMPNFVKGKKSSEGPCVKNGDMMDIDADDMQIDRNV